MRLEFEGKQQVYGHHLTVPIAPLVPHDDNSMPTDPKERDHGNLIIHGDNLHALKALMPKYAGRVKCIYIDPPYNTGNEKWKYNDNVNGAQLRSWLAKQSPVDGEDLERHDKWCCMMWPRLQLLRELLSDEGVIFVSIDDNEQHHLRMLMDEIFGSENYIGTFVWEGTGKNDARFVSVGHDYVVCYALRLQLTTQNKKRWRAMKEGVSEIYSTAKSLQKEHQGDNSLASAGLKEWFGSLDKRHKSFPHRHYSWIDQRGVYFAGDISWPGGGGPRYDVEHPTTGRPVKVPAGGWRFPDKVKMQEAIVQDRVHFGVDDSTVPNLKRYLHETDGQVLTSVFYQDRRAAHKSLVRLLPEVSFEYPKDERVIRRLLEVCTSEDDIILDSFAGSGTTAHAVLALNHEDGGNRQFILVECGDYADNITAERVRRVITGYDNSNGSAYEGMGGSFTYCTLGEPLNVSDMLKGASLPSYRELAVFVYFTATGQTIDAARIDVSGEKPFHRDKNRDYWLLYRPDFRWLRSSSSAFTVDDLDRVCSGKRRVVVFASHKYIPQRKLSDRGITFCQIPYVEQVVD